jgi:hypothetical protein
MTKDQIHDDRAPLIELGAATELTQGTFMPHATESVLVKDFFDEP